MAIRYYVLGAVLMLVGIVGFLRPSPLLGVFEVTPPLNALHVGAGALAIGAATRGLGTMRAWGKRLGFIFAGLTIAGFAVDAATIANVLPLTDSNAWFHLVIALVFLYHALLAPPTL
jgi:hypothetical protein